jgi:hypothetical protein
MRKSGEIVNVLVGKDAKTLNKTLEKHKKNPVWNL